MLKKSVFSILILISLLTYSCGNDDNNNEVFTTNQFTELISLSADEDNVTITWTPTYPVGFVSYEIYRLESHTNELGISNTIKFQGELIHTITDNQITFFTDTQVPYNSYVNYMVVAVYENPESGELEDFDSINYLYLERPELVFEILSAEKLTNGEIKVTWQEDSNEQFQNYRLFSYDNLSTINSAEFISNNGILLGQIEIQNQNEFVDTSVHSDPGISYSVTKFVNGKSIISKNSVSINNPGSIGFKPFESLKNPFNTSEIILFGNEGDIAFYDTSTLEILENIELNKRIYQPIIEDYNGTLALYIPSELGKIFIYDLMNYSLLNEIDLATEREIISIIFKENYLIFLESFITSSFSNISYLNLDDNSITRNPGFISKNTKLFNANDEFFFRVQPSYNGTQNDSSLHMYELINGELVFTRGVDNGSIKSGDVFAVSPDFSFIVSTAYGFHLDMDYNDLSETNLGNYGFQMSFDGINYIGNQNQYSDIKITIDNNVLLSVRDEQKVMVHQAYNFQNAFESFDTTGNPLLFEILDNNQIIVINGSLNTPNYFIERIPMN